MPELPLLPVSSRQRHHFRPPRFRLLQRVPFLSAAPLPPSTESAQRRLCRSGKPVANQPNATHATPVKPLYDTTLVPPPHTTTHPLMHTPLIASLLPHLVKRCACTVCCTMHGVHACCASHTCVLHRRAQVPLANIPAGCDLIHVDGRHQYLSVVQDTLNLLRFANQAQAFISHLGPHARAACRPPCSPPTIISQSYPNHIPIVSQSYPNRIPVVSQSYPNRVPIISQSCPNHIPLISQSYPNQNHIPIICPNRIPIKSISQSYVRQSYPNQNHIPIICPKIVSQSKSYPNNVLIIYPRAPTSNHE